MIFIVLTTRMMHLINMRGRRDILKHGVRGMSHCGWETQFCGSIIMNTNSGIVYDNYNFLGML
jgi:hypothetical protein